MDPDGSSILPSKTSGNIVSFALFFCAVALFAYQVRIVTFPYPLEFREGAMIQTTKALLDGENPYALHNQPQDTNVYGVFYSVVSYTLAGLFGPGLEINRAVAGIFTLLSCAIVYLFARTGGHPFLPSFSVTAVFYASLLYGVTPLVRHDSLAACFPSDSRVRRRLKRHRSGILDSIKTGTDDMIVLTRRNDGYPKFITRPALEQTYARERTLIDPCRTRSSAGYAMSG